MAHGLRFSADQIAAIRQRVAQKRGSNNNNGSHTDANVEPDSGHAPLAKKETPRFDSRVDLHVHSVRFRLADADGISAKAAIDGIVKAGLIRDDSPQFVRQVTYSQEKISKKEGEEKTIITLTPIR